MKIEFMTSPYSMKIVDEISPFVKAIKIGSGDITWIDIIKKISKKKKSWNYCNWRIKSSRSKIGS